MIPHVSAELLEQLAIVARQSPRKRKNYNFHQLEDNVQRMLNCLCEDTYCRPHRHADPPKHEFFIPLTGEVGVLLFDEQGNITDRVRCDRIQSFGTDIPVGAYHTVVALSPIATCFETKSGPYIKSTDKIFAPWAPEEDSKDVSEYLAFLKSHF